jgi:hypothetical protein
MRIQIRTAVLVRWACAALGLLVFPSCRTAHDVAVTSFRIVDAPANYLRRHIDQENTTESTTTTVTSDVTAPGYPVAESQPAPPQSHPGASSQHTMSVPSPAAGPAPPHDRSVTAETRPTHVAPTTAQESQPAAGSQPAHLPYGKPVPGKPGYVFSPFDPSGGYVDVSGYTPGSKVKDPYSGKIFLVP